MSSAKTTSPEFTGRHMWMLIGGFFGVVISVNIGMAVLSSTSWTGLVVDNSYVASQQFETRRVARETQLAAGWTSTLTYADGTITLRVTQAAGKPVDLAEVTLKVTRPVGGHDDQSLPLVQAADGSYSARLALDTGLWDAHVVAADTVLGPYDLYERFSVRGE